jgi:hypothetical protein
MAAPAVFISYSWDSRPHRTWVRKLAERLEVNGVRVWLDEWHVRPGESLTAFMESKIRASGHVLVICTPTYARKANLRRGGVGYEQQIISGHIAAGVPRRKFIPIIRAGSLSPGRTCSIPTHFSGIFAVDMSTPQRVNKNFEDLLRTIHRVPRHSLPLQMGGSASSRGRQTRLANAEIEGWWLGSGVVRHQQNPRTFEIPSERARHSLRADQLVKLTFEHNTDEMGFVGERMWVRVTGIDGPYYVGKLSNVPTAIPLRFGSKVVFLPEHVIAVVPVEDAQVFAGALKKRPGAKMKNASKAAKKTGRASAR